MRKINKKGVGAINKVVALIIAIVVVVSVFLFIFRADILSWVRSLPSFQPDPDEEINVDDLGDDELAELEGLGCENVVARMGSVPQESLFIQFLFGESRSFSVERAYRFYPKGVYFILENSGNHILAYRSDSSVVNLGQIDSNGKLILDPSIIQSSGYRYGIDDKTFEEKYGMSSLDFAWIKDSKLVKNSLVFCKTDEQVQEYESWKVERDKKKEEIQEDSADLQVAPPYIPEYGGTINPSLRIPEEEIDEEDDDEDFKWYKPWTWF